MLIFQLGKMIIDDDVNDILVIYIVFYIKKNCGHWSSHRVKERKGGHFEIK